MCIQCFQLCVLHQLVKHKYLVSGGTYQGYPPNNYRPEGFQGNFSASALPGTVYQKRGGMSNASNPASTTGYARGGTAGNGNRGGK